MFRRRKKEPDPLDSAIWTLLKGKTTQEILDLVDQARLDPQGTANCPYCALDCTVILGLLIGHSDPSTWSNPNLSTLTNPGIACPASWQPAPTPNIIFET